MAIKHPARGEIWDADLDPPHGHEPDGTRPMLIISVDPFNQGLSGLVIGLPISTKDKKVRSQVPVDGREGGLKTRSFIKCEAVRSVAIERLGRRWGVVSQKTINTVEDCLRILMGL